MHIAIDDHSRLAYVEDGADVGADAYITKGAFNDDRLIEAVRNFV